MPCERFELEIIETLLIEHSETAVATLEELRDLGFRIALDDFGTGYSSLSYLRRFRVDKVKLDRSFMSDADGAGGSKNVIAIVRGAVALGHALGLEVVAEGIETEEHERIALSAGCDGLQGYLYSPAVPADKIDSVLRRSAGAAFDVAALRIA